MNNKRKRTSKKAPIPKKKRKRNANSSNRYQILSSDDSEETEFEESNESEQNASTSGTENEFEESNEPEQNASVNEIIQRKILTNARKTELTNSTQSENTLKFNPFGLAMPSAIFVPVKPVKPVKKPKKKSQPKEAKKQKAKKLKNSNTDKLNLPVAKPPAINFARSTKYQQKKAKPISTSKQRNLKVALKEHPYNSTPGIPTTKHPMPQLKDFKPPPDFRPDKDKVVRQGDKLDKNTEELFTIVMSLGAFLRNTSPETTPWHKEAIRQAIETAVPVISKLAIEASLLIYHEYMEVFDVEPRLRIIEKPDFRGIFASLNATSKGYNNTNITAQTSSYRQLRRRHNVNKGHLYNGTNRTNSISMEADAYETALKNNIMDNTYNWIRSFFKIVAPRKPSYDTLGDLFTKNSQNKFDPDVEMLEMLQRELQIENVSHYFSDIYKSWWTYIPVLVRLQRWRRERNLKNFRVFPIFKMKRRHYKMDGQAFQQLMNGVSKINYQQAFKPNARQHWSNIFNVAKIESERIINGVDYGHKFNEFVSTDGVKISIVMRRRKLPIVTNKQFLEKIKTNLDNQHYKQLIALDPGARLSFAGIRRELPSNAETSITYSSSSYRYDSNQYQLNAKYRRHTNARSIVLQNERNALTNKASCLVDRLEFINFQLNHFDENVPIFMAKTLAKIELQRYSGRQRAIVKVARAIVHGQSNSKTYLNTLVFVGSTNISPIIRGYVKTPNRAIVKEMSRIATVVNVHEHRSTMLCSRCFKPCITSRSPHRWQHCSDCKIRWNRDVNAGRNIMYLGLAMVNETLPDRGFSHGFRFEKNAKGYQTKSRHKPHTRRETIKLRRQQRLQLPVADPPAGDA